MRLLGDQGCHAISSSTNLTRLLLARNVTLRRYRLRRCRRHHYKRRSLLLLLHLLRLRLRLWLRLRLRLGHGLRLLGVLLSKKLLALRHLRLKLRWRQCASHLLVLRRHRTISRICHLVSLQTWYQTCTTLLMKRLLLFLLRCLGH